ncbi:MAG: hypothetical protein AAFO07_28700 [Bacteroidota bacterium]
MINRNITHSLVGVFFICFCLSCQKNEKVPEMVITDDIDHFWEAYDLITDQTDTLKQIELFDSLYIKKGSEGLHKIMEARNYTTRQYVNLINQHPKYWNSIRKNTYQSKGMAKELNNGIERLRAIYPELKPAKIYFTFGAMRTNGTTYKDLVLIGSELAMADSLTDISEFEGRTKDWLKNYFGGNPIEGLVLLNIHEYVHTQQKPIPQNLLYQTLYEGVAEFVSVKAMGVPSDSPAIEYGKSNPEVKRKFEKEMFFERTYEWLWSNAPNEFDVRDLGYYIGYAIAELYFNQKKDKRLAIKELIEIDYSQLDKVEALIDGTSFFSKPIKVLKAEDSKVRPKILAIRQFDNKDQNVDPYLQKLTIEFSEPLNGYNTGVDYGSLGEEGFPKVLKRTWASDATSWTMDVELEPNTRYQILISNNFRTEQGLPLMPYLIEFKTAGR